MSIDIAAYVALLRAGIDSQETDAETAKAVKAIRRVIKSNLLALDWSTIESQLPTTSADVTDLDKIATTLEVIASDDEAACAAVADWADARPVKKSRTASGDTVRDLDQWTCVTIYNGSGQKVHENVRAAGGQMYSLQFPAGAYLRKKAGVSPADWRPVLKFIQKCGKAGQADEMKVGEYTVKVTV